MVVTEISYVVITKNNSVNLMFEVYWSPDKSDNLEILDVICRFFILLIMFCTNFSAHQSGHVVDNQKENKNMKNRLKN